MKTIRFEEVSEGVVRKVSEEIYDLTAVRQQVDDLRSVSEALSSLAYPVGMGPELKRLIDQHNKLIPDIKNHLLGLMVARAEFKKEIESKISKIKAPE